MDKEKIIEEILQEEGIKKTIEELKAYAVFSEDEIYSLLLTLALLTNADKEALKYIAPVYENHKDMAEVAYWHASALAFKAESLDEYIEAKGAMLDALSLGLKGEMENDALNKLEFIENRIGELL